MKKLFFVLLGLCFVGAAALFWLMQSAPVPSVAKSEVPHGESHAEEGDAHGEHGGEASDHASAETHAAPAAAAEHGAAHGEAVEHAAPVAEAKPAVHAPEAGLLSLATEPVDAEVLVDGQSVGRTPFRLKVEGGMKKVELVAEGFETYAREVPADATSGGAATWKVQLKPVKGAHATPPSRPAPAAAPKAAAPKASAHAETHAPAPAPKSSAAPAAASAPATPAGEPSGPMAKGGDVYMRGDLGRWFNSSRSPGTVPSRTRPSPKPSWTSANSRAKTCAPAKSTSWPRARGRAF